jgi:hypothetical protein
MSQLPLLQLRQVVCLIFYFVRYIKGFLPSFMRGLVVITVLVHRLFVRKINIFETNKTDTCR